MALPKLIKTRFRGIAYYNDELKGKIFVAVITIDKKIFRKIIGWSNDDYGTNEKSAYFKREQWLSELKNGKAFADDVESSKVKKIYTYNLLFQEYLISCKHSQSPKTISTKEYYHKKHLENNLGLRLIDGIKTVDIQNIINEMIVKGYQPQTTKHIKNIIRATLKYANELKYLADNVADAVKIPKFDNKVEFTLSTEESKKLFDTILHFEEPMYRDIFIFLIHGRRKNEVLQMKWEYINLENRTYDVRASINKTRRNLRYPITDLLYDILYEREEKSGFVFVNPETKKPFRDIRKAWDRIKAKAKISKPMRLHDLRHLIGNIIINDLAGSNSVAAAILGHSSTQMVDKRYSSVRVDTISKGINSVFEYLGK